MAKNVIQLENITKTYIVGETEVRALRGVTYAIKEGEFLAILGASGSGKSTLINETLYRALARHLYDAADTHHSPIPP
jgi:ABC-type lipoprotein export system ATPase subunit